MRLTFFIDDRKLSFFGRDEDGVGLLQRDALVGSHLLSVDTINIHFFAADDEAKYAKALANFTVKYEGKVIMSLRKRGALERCLNRLAEKKKS